MYQRERTNENEVKELERTGKSEQERSNEKRWTRKYKWEITNETGTNEPERRKKKNKRNDWAKIKAKERMHEKEWMRNIKNRDRKENLN